MTKPESAEKHFGGLLEVLKSMKQQRPMTQMKSDLWEWRMR
jgi:gentisate 1,2-dioxygenase